MSARPFERGSGGAARRRCVPKSMGQRPPPHPRGAEADAPRRRPWGVGSEPHGEHGRSAPPARNGMPRRPPRPCRGGPRKQGHHRGDRSRSAESAGPLVGSAVADAVSRSVGGRDLGPHPSRVVRVPSESANRSPPLAGARSDPGTLAFVSTDSGRRQKRHAEQSCDVEHLPHSRTAAAGRRDRRDGHSAAAARAVCATTAPPAGRPSDLDATIAAVVIRRENARTGGSRTIQVESRLVSGPAPYRGSRCREIGLRPCDNGRTDAARRLRRSRTPNRRLRGEADVPARGAERPSR